MHTPSNLRYTSDHEWARIDGGGLVRIGITDFAQSALGDVVFVELPSVGRTIDAGTAIGEVESTKSVSEIYAPLSGTIVAVNEALNSEPAHLNEDPYGEGWLCEIELSDASEVDRLLDAAAYEALTSE